MNHDDLKSKIASFAWLIAIVVGAVVFVIAYNIVRGTGRDWPLSLGIAAVLFLVSAIASWLLASNVVDAYTLDAADIRTQVFATLRSIRTEVRKVKHQPTVLLVQKLCSDCEALIERTRVKQPNNYLSTVQILEKLLPKVLDPGLSEYLDAQDNPQFNDNPDGEMRSARSAFTTFDDFLIRSIKTIEKGHNVDFDVAMSILESTKHNLA